MKIKKIKDKLLNRHKNYCIVNNIVSYEKELKKEEKDIISHFLDFEEENNKTRKEFENFISLIEGNDLNCDDSDGKKHNSKRKSLKRKSMKRKSLKRNI
jgi:hypothetical protein